MIALHDNSPAVVSPGIYPMLYAFFDDRGVLRQDPFRRQVDAALGTQAAGVAILGLGTEVSKLTFDERIEVLEVVAKRIDGRKPLLATVYGDTITEQIEFSKQSNSKRRVGTDAPASLAENGRCKVGGLLLRDYLGGRLPGWDSECAGVPWLRTKQPELDRACE